MWSSSGNRATCPRQIRGRLQNGISQKTKTYYSKSLFAEEDLTVQKESCYSGDNSQFNLYHLLGASSCDVLLGTIITRHDGTQPPT